MVMWTLAKIKGMARIFNFALC